METSFVVIKVMRYEKMGFPQFLINHYNEYLGMLFEARTLVKQREVNMHKLAVLLSWICCRPEWIVFYIV